MTKTESLLKKSPLYPALILEGYFYKTKRKLLIKITKYLLLSIPLIIILSIIFGNYGIGSPSQIADFLIRKLIGVALFSLGTFILMNMFETYFASVYYFEYVAKNKYSAKDVYTFSAGRIFIQVKNDNLLTGLLKYQSFGGKIIDRLGISPEEAEALLEKQLRVKNAPYLNTEGIPLIKVSHIVNFVYENYPDFKNLLTSHGLKQKDLEMTVDWVIYNIEAREYNRRWWTKEKLAKIPGVATDWSFGRTYLLTKYSRELLSDDEVNSEAISFSSRARELEQMQAVLARSHGANVIVTGEPGQEKMEVVWNLCRKIKNKTANPNLVGKRPVLFLATNFTSAINNKDDFESKLVTIFSEAMESGNTILVIDNFPRLILQAEQYDLNLYEIIEPFLASNNDQIIALADTEYFHTLIEPDQAVMSRFEVISTKPLLLDEIIKIISREALGAEKVYEIMFTYPAILEIAKSADYYFTNGVSGDKAHDLLAEIAPWAVENNITVIGKNEVLTYVGGKINIPIASITTGEKEKLLDLENQLMKRVIAQREAIFAVSNAIRRSRAGIRNEKRPIGSFLFLGPTGVGKTETAKALAEVFFGDEKLLMRLDMSEYQGGDALGRLIGSETLKIQGTLSNMLREHPYGVLLLDEFEKTNKDILNLFLQIIDEGYFSDSTGKKVMARNIMFVATSNAGAEKIFETIKSGKDLKNHEEEIISEVVKQGVFKPELINRFDATILFHPLTKENLAEIAKLMLQKVAKRIGEKGMTLIISNELINFVVQGGYNPSFGARPMNRLIQDTIEQHLADLIIRGNLNAGQTIGFSITGNNTTKENLIPEIK